MGKIPGSISALVIQGLSLAHFNSINRYNHKQTILNEPQCSQGIVYPRLHTTHSILNDKLTITYPANNSTQELLHPNIIKAALPQSKLSRGLWVLCVNTPVLRRVWSHTTTHPAFKAKQGVIPPNCVLKILKDGALIPHTFSQNPQKNPHQMGLGSSLQSLLLFFT